MITNPIFLREDLAQFFGSNPRLMRAFEDQSAAVQETTEAVSSTVAATESLQDATVVVLSANGAFTNERILQLEPGLEMVDNGTHVTIRLEGVARTSDYDVTLIPPGDATLFLPLTGTLVTRENAETLAQKTLSAPKLTALGNHVDDVAAAAGGVPVGGVYRNGSVVMVRVV